MSDEGACRACHRISTFTANYRAKLCRIWLDELVRPCSWSVLGWVRGVSSLTQSGGTCRRRRDLWSAPVWTL